MKAETRLLIAAAGGVMVLSYLSTFSHFMAGPPVIDAIDAGGAGGAGGAGHSSATPPHQQGGRGSAAQRVRRLLDEPSPDIRGMLLYGLIDSLEPEEFPAMFEALNQQFGHQNSQIQEWLLDHWMAADPRGAWVVIRPMFAFTAPSRYADDWGEILIPPREPERLASSTFWPRRELYDAFPLYVNASSLSELEKSELNAEFLHLYREHFDADYTLPTQVRSPHQAMLQESSSEMLAVLDAPADELRTHIEQAMINSNEYALAIGLRRLVESDPRQAPGALDLVAGEPAAKQTLPVLEILRAWGRGDPDGAWSWLQDNRPGELTGLLGQGIIAYLDDQQRKELLETALPIEGDWPGEFGDLVAAWAESEPSPALHAARELDGDEAASHVAYCLFDDSKTGEELGEIAAILNSDPGLLQDGDAAQLMETWGDWNVASAARFGVNWLLNTRSYSREEVLEVWLGAADPTDGLVPDRAFGCLRCWALAQPEEMRSWIASQPEPDVRAALQWLLEHASGE